MNSKIMLKAFFAFIFIFSSAISSSHSSTQDDRKSYIVYMGAKPKVQTHVLEDHHHSLLANAIGDEEIARRSKIYSYGRSFNGFAAKLLPHEAKILAKEKSVVSVFESKLRQLHTTRSWDYLGLSESMSKKNAAAESNMIIGLLDSGIWMKAPSFNDNGYGPIPSKWKGKCVTGSNFTSCNRKVIGAMFFNLENLDTGDNNSPADDIGHGTHTASTAAGNSVRGASLYGVAKGTARGGVPSARIAMYKVCWPQGCTDMDILAGFDHAIADGVDMISVSLGGASAEYFEDPIAIGSFHAIEKGILTSCSGGNSGPFLETVENAAPWIMTVAATSIDRGFSTVVRLGNNKRFSGISINTFSLKKKMYPLTSGAKAASNDSDGFKIPSYCDDGALDTNKVKGKIVYCLGVMGQEETIRKLGGVGLVANILGVTDIALTTPMPSTYLSTDDGDMVDQYINSTKNPTAVILKTTTTRIDAPFVAVFSSRGPQTVANEIMKPDVAAPGLDILAAYSKLPPVIGKLHSVFNILSGTSMACPHAAGAAAYLKTIHPKWSPSAIKSALMTTATPVKITQELDLLGVGAGQINPRKAVHPGLIYDLSIDSYIAYLCTKRKYDGSVLGVIVGRTDKYNCSEVEPAKGFDALNYPTMYLPLDGSKETTTAVFHRRVTNVGYGSSVYKAKVTAPVGLSVKVIPETLEFDRSYQKRSFKVVVKGGPMPKGVRVLTATLEWDDSKHNVRSQVIAFKR